MNIFNIYKIACKEITFNIKNYWFILAAFIFCFFNFIIIYFGEVLSGDRSQTDIRALLLSVIHLQMYIIPLLSFILSYDTILSEKESGVLDLFLSYRLTLLDILFGKLIGNSLVFALAFLVGFLPISLYLFYIGVNLFVILKFIIISIWLSFIFNFFALYISNSSKSRTLVILLSMFIWLFFLFIYDIIFTFFVVIFYDVLSNSFLSLLLFLNPAEVFRLISIFYFIPAEANDLFGINVGFFSTFYVILSMIVWIFVVFLNFLFIYIKSK